MKNADMIQGNTEIMSIENRKRKRVSTLKKGQLIFNNSHCVVDCTVRNISETGACLELPCFIELPDTLTLMIPGGPKRECEVMWVSNNKLGVRFFDQSAVSGRNSPRKLLLLRVQSIQEQLDDLRTEIEKSVAW